MISLAMALPFIVTAPALAQGPPPLPSTQDCEECEPLGSAGNAEQASGLGLLVDTTDFPPRWYCGAWTPVHGWIHIVSDFLIWLSYMSIPAALLWVARRRQDFPFRHLFLMFGLFIVACGFTHLLEAAVFWWPAYRVLGLLKALTAAISVGTAIVLTRVMPDALSLRSPAQLEVEVATRTSELQRSQQQLRAAKEEAEQANQSKSTFLASMSHEIRTPLTAILGFSSLLRDEPDNPDSMEHADTIHRNGEHLLSVLDDILDLSKIEAGRMEFESGPVDLRTLVSDCVSLFHARANEKGIELSGTVAEAVPFSFHSDGVRVKQVILNLVGNAIKFTSEGSVSLHVSLSPHDAGRLRFDVSDTGIGIPPEASRRVFDPFRQAEDSTNRRFGGTGLGLTISGFIAEKLGGFITLVKSEIDVGSQFRLEIPLNLSSLPQGTQKSEQPSSDVSLTGLDFVLAEDAPDSHRLIRHFLTKAGARVTSAHDGIEAVEILTARLAQSEPPTAILMDMQMPRMDGYEATRAIRSLGYTGPILALTAHAMSSHRDRCFEAGCDGFAGKPIERTELISTLSRLVTSQEERELEGTP